MYKRILIIADIEGSTGCSGYDASSFNTAKWYDACIDMSLDINEVVLRLFENGAEKIYVKDFHRTGFNLLPELIDKRANVIHGYRIGPVPGIGDIYDSEAVMFIGMHASSGSGGFLAHTLTSRYGHILVNGGRVSELELFASSLYRYQLFPVFFSGCRIACGEAENVIAGIGVYPVEKDEFGLTDKISSRKKLSIAAAESLNNCGVSPFTMLPPFNVELKMRDGSAAAVKIAERWGLDFKGDRVFFNSAGFDEFYDMLVKITYFTPVLVKIRSLALFLFNLFGRAGLSIVRFKRGPEIKKIRGDTGHVTRTI